MIKKLFARMDSGRNEIFFFFFLSFSLFLSLSLSLFYFFIKKDIQKSSLEGLNGIMKWMYGNEAFTSIMQRIEGENKTETNKLLSLTVPFSKYWFILPCFGC